jgi:RNA polymerase sigma-70 factor (ECF subfamily)
VIPSDIVPPNTGPTPAPEVDDVRWLQPYPDSLLDEASGPEAQVIARETIELAFIAAVQLLPPRQRAAFLVRDVLGWSPGETASLLETSIASVNSLVQRARATLQGRCPASRSDWASVTEISNDERALLDGFMHACERGDAAAVIDLLSENVRCSMPPYTWWFAGREAVAESFRLGLGSYIPGEFRLVPLRANRQPACAAHVRRAGEPDFSAFAIDVLRMEHGRIVEIIAFQEVHLFDMFGLRPTWQPNSRAIAMSTTASPTTPRKIPISPERASPVRH